MCAFDFQPRFVPLIRDGYKRQTIRLWRRRPPLEGEYLQLYTGMRTARCEKIVADPLCISVLPIFLAFEDGEIATIEVSGVPLTNRDGFAQADGFTDAADMAAFWRQHHGTEPFTGMLVQWSMPREPEARAA